MLIYNKEDNEFVTEFPCLLGHPVHYLFSTLSASIFRPKIPENDLYYLN